MTAEDRAAMASHVAMLSSALTTDALPPRTAIPRNLRQGIYRGGRRPLDIYRRIYAGINGMPMPGVGPATPGAKGTLEPDEIWNLVDYVLSLPYEAGQPAAPQTCQPSSVSQRRWTGARMPSWLVETVLAGETRPWESFGAWCSCWCPCWAWLAFVVAPLYKHWLPHDISQHGHTIDHLFYFILWLTGAVFVVTEVALFWFMWRYDSEGQRKPVKFTHGSHSLEIVWTIIPAAALLFIAIYQMNAWAEAKIRNPAAGPDGILGTADDMPPTLEVTGRQFEWRLRYPGLKAKGQARRRRRHFRGQRSARAGERRDPDRLEERRRAAQLFPAQLPESSRTPCRA